MTNEKSNAKLNIVEYFRRQSSLCYLLPTLKAQLISKKEYHLISNESFRKKKNQRSYSTEVFDKVTAHPTCT